MHKAHMNGNAYEAWDQGALWTIFGHNFNDPATGD